MELNLMSPEETNRLAELEEVIQTDLKGFIRVGMALKEIRDKRLYRSKYVAWKDYLRGEWDLSKSYGEYQIAATDVVKNLESNVHNCGRFEILPQNESQARPLTLLPPEQQPIAWQNAIVRSGGKVTALDVMKEVKEILEIQLEQKKDGIQKDIVKEVSVPDDFSNQFTRLIEILALYRKSGWKDFNRKKALEFVNAIEQYLKS
jgi:hypothetical protein